MKVMILFKFLKVTMKQMIRKNCLVQRYLLEKMEFQIICKAEFN